MATQTKVAIAYLRCVICSMVAAPANQARHFKVVARYLASAMLLAVLLCLAAVTASTWVALLVVQSAEWLLAPLVACWVAWLAAVWAVVVGATPMRWEIACLLAPI
jgi:hypothetical protein